MSKILITSSESNFLDSLRSRLDKFSAVIETSDNAYDSVRKVDNNSYLLLVIDLKAAPLDGTQLVSILQKKGIETPIIVTATKFTELDIKKISKLNITNLVLKSDLESKLKVILESMKIV